MPAMIKVNPLGLASTDEGYISSITIRTGGADVVFTPSTDAATYGELQTGDPLALQQISNSAATNLLTRSFFGDLSYTS